MTYDHITYLRRIADLERIKSKADSVKMGTLKEQVEFLLGKENPSLEDIDNYIKGGETNVRTAAFFLDDPEFKDFQRISILQMSNSLIKDDEASRMKDYDWECYSRQFAFLTRVPQDFQDTSVVDINVNRQGRRIPDFEKLRLEAKAVKEGFFRQWVEFLLFKENPSEEDVKNYFEQKTTTTRTVALFLDDVKFSDFSRIYVAVMSDSPLKDGDLNRIREYREEYELLQIEFLLEVLENFGNVRRPPNVLDKPSVQPAPEKVLEKEEVSITLPECLNRTELDKKATLEALNKVIPNIQKVIDDTGILVWDEFDNIENNFLYDFKVHSNISDIIHKIMPKGTHFVSESSHFLNFPSLRVKYLKRGVPCLDWITCVQTIAEVSLKLYIGKSYLGGFFLTHYIEPEVTGMEPHSIFLTPLRLMECLTKGVKEADGVEMTGQPDRRNPYNKTLYNATKYSVTGFPKEFELPDTFIEWVMKFSEGKGLKEFSSKMRGLGVMNAGTYEMVLSRIESKTEPKVEGPILSVKDTERLRIIQKVNRMPSFGQWVKAFEKYGKKANGIIFKSTQGFIDFLDRMEAGGYIKVHKDKSGVWIELTEKGLMAIA